MKYLRVHKQIEDAHTEWHICELSDNAPASHYTDGTIPALSAIWKVFEVDDEFRKNNPPSSVEPIDIEKPEFGSKWLHTDSKWYEVKRPCHHTQLYDIDTGVVLCHFAQHTENLETEIV